MKLAIDCRSLVIPVSGIGRYTQQLVRWLPEMLDPERDRILYVLGLGIGVVENLDRITKRVDHRRSRGLQTIWEQTLLPWYLARQAVDIYHAPRNYSIPPVRITPIVVTIHDVIPLMFPEHTGVRGWSIRARFARAARMADVVITVSHRSKQDILEYLRIPEERIRVIPLAPAEVFERPVDPSRIRDVRRVHGLSGRFVLTTGGTKPLKNVPFLVHLWPELLSRLDEPALLVVAGAEWPGHPFPGNTRHVRFLGEVSDDDLVALMQGAELFAFPSLYEGFGLPVLEAMAAGTPVVASNRGALMETVGDAGIVLPLENAQAWMDAIKVLLDNRDKRRELAQAGRQRAGGFSWKRTVSETLRVYREVCSARPRY